MTAEDALFRALRSMLEDAVGHELDAGRPPDAPALAERALAELGAVIDLRAHKETLRARLLQLIEKQRA